MCAFVVGNTQAPPPYHHVRWLISNFIGKHPDLGFPNGHGPFVEGVFALNVPYPKNHTHTERVLHFPRQSHRGYAERSRREHTWDPGSAFYAEGATKHHIAGSRSCNGGSNEGTGRGIGRASSIGGTSNRKHQRDRRRRSQVAADVHPVDMDWEKVTSGKPPG